MQPIAALTWTSVQARERGAKLLAYKAQLPSCRVVRAAIVLTEVPTEAEDEFDDFERECFGDEEGCDAWFYGEDPDAEDEPGRELTPERAAALKAEGQAARDLRIKRQAQTEVLLQRLKSIQ